MQRTLATEMSKDVQRECNWALESIECPRKLVQQVSCTSTASGLHDRLATPFLGAELTSLVPTCTFASSLPQHCNSALLQNA